MHTTSVNQKQTILIGFATSLLLASLFWMQSSDVTPSQKGPSPGEVYQLTAQYPAFGEGLDMYKFAVQDELRRMKRTRSINTPWQHEGPFNTGGRINSIAVPPGTSNTYWVGCADGGIFKTTDDGNNWTPIFDQESALAVSQITFEPGNANTVYVGTGDQVLGGYSHMGNGIYKSTDGGTTFNNIGLQQVGAISKIIVDPVDVNTLYVGATGNPFISDSNRGVYKSTDGGSSWSRILFLGPNAGVADMVIHPTNPSILYATGRRRIRSDVQSILNGPEARIYRSTNGGMSWDTLSNGLPGGKQSRIGLCISPNNPNILYANYVDTLQDQGGLYKTVNGGNTWSLVNNTMSGTMGGFGWYFGQIRIDPNNDNVLYMLNVNLYKSTNGGSSFTDITTTMHVDNHDLVFVNSNKLILATDGGCYTSGNAGNTWVNKNNFPITQFYEVASNPWDTVNYYGGAQDNGTNFGSLSSNPNNWMRYYGGDGFRPQFNPQDDQVMYAEWQNGNVVASTDGGNFFDNITGSITSSDRCSWNTPYMISRFNPNTLYLGSYRVYKNTSGPVDAWFPISGDLTNGTPNSFHVITTIDQSPLNDQMLYAGTSDARLWVTQNDGGSWTPIYAGLSNRNISCVLASPDSLGHVFVSQTGYRNNDSIPHLYFSRNNGNSWINISGNLPNFAINDIWVKAGTGDSSIVIASDGGVYATRNKGILWERVGNNMPIIPVYDLDYHAGTKRIMAGTFARSMMSMPIDSIFKTQPSIVQGTNGVLKEGQISVYPNPCSTFCKVDAKGIQIETAELFDLRGALLRRIKPSTGQFQIDVKGMQPGMYILSFRTKQGRQQHALYVK